MQFYNIILEGPGGVGKSTVLKELEKMFKRVETKHCIPVYNSLARNTLMDIDRQYWIINEREKRYTFYDRWYGISHLVYTGVDHLQGDEYFLTKRVLRHRTTLIVIFTADEAIFKERIPLRDAQASVEEKIDLDIILKANTDYARLAQLLETEANQPVLHLHFNTMEEACNIKRIVGKILERMSGKDGN